MVMEVMTDTGTGFDSLAKANRRLEAMLETRTGTIAVAKIEHIQGRQWLPFCAVVGTA